MLNLTQKTGVELINLFNQIFQKENSTGYITAENNESNIKSKIFIQDNQIVYANSTMYHSRFGDIMIKKGIITPKELNTALKIQKEDPEKPLIGHILVDMGVISERLIPDLLFHQIEFVIYEILSWKSANLRFEEYDITKHPDYNSPVSKNEIKDLYSNLTKLSDSKSYIKDLSNRLESIVKIRQHINNPEYQPRKTSKDYPAQLTFDQRKILRAVDGVNSINDILILSNLDYVKTYQIIYNLAQDGIIKIDNLNFNNSNSNLQSISDNQNKKLREDLKELQEKLNKIETYFSSELINKLKNVPDEKKDLLIKTFNNIIDLSL